MEKVNWSQLEPTAKLKNGPIEAGATESYHQLCLHIPPVLASFLIIEIEYSLKVHFDINSFSTILCGNCISCVNMPET